MCAKGHIQHEAGLRLSTHNLPLVNSIKEARIKGKSYMNTHGDHNGQPMLQGGTRKKVIPCADYCRNVGI